ncbi:hypothetical protein [Micropruina sp.]|uniref:hypothetical protein n=1 Tax=Micropruina sp. TaxID=2737536 RepID=UPI0039E35C90
MTGLVAFAVVALLVAIVVGMMRRPKKSRRMPTSTVRTATWTAEELGLLESDLAELTAAGHRIEQEFGRAPVQMLLYRVGNVVRRNVPLRAVRPGPSRGLARMCFADGTTLQVQGRHVGDLGQLAVTAVTHKVRVSDFHAEQSLVVLDLDWDRGHVSVLAVGLDQDD